MSAEFGNGMEMIAQHEVVRLLAGTIEPTRQRLIVALEQLGYRVISEIPLQARHGATGWASAYLSSNALEYPTQLEVHFRSQGATATQVTFEYRVQHSGIFTAGDCQTLTREAEAIVALATQQAQQGTCAGCGTVVSGDARFCRKCGAPIKPAVPAELEVLRLTAGARAGYQWIVLSLLISLGSLFFPTLAFLVGKPLFKFLVIAAVINAISLWAMGAGLQRLHLTLNPKTESDAPRLPAAPQAVPGAITNELPPAQMSHSISEATTGLLPPLTGIPQQSIRQEKEKRLA